MSTYEKVFKSAECTGTKEYQLATGYISTTEIYFEAEKTVIRIEAAGKVTFMDNEENVIVSVNVPEQTGGKGTYNDVICSVEENKIVLKLPVVEWIDNYPHCDGEHDRWDCRTIGYHMVKFEPETNKAEVINEA